MKFLAPWNWTRRMQMRTMKKKVIDRNKYFFLRWNCVTFSFYIHLPFSLCSGLILPSGEINWDCPCLGGMASGVCGEQFKTAFTCFHFSQEELKGSDCLEQFRSMQECFRQHPEHFPQDDDIQSANPGSNAEQKDSPSIADFSTSKESDPLPTGTNDMPSQLPIAS